MCKPINRFYLIKRKLRNHLWNPRKSLESWNIRSYRDLPLTETEFSEKTPRLYWRVVGSLIQRTYRSANVHAGHLASGVPTQEEGSCN